MGIFDRLGGQAPMRGSTSTQPGPTMEQALGQIKANPGNYLKAKGYSIPDGMTDARQITQYLLQSGQIGIPRLQQAASMFGWTPGRR